MKRSFLIIQFLFLLSVTSIFAKGFDFFWDLGNVNLGGQFSKEEAGLAFDVQLGKLRLESDSGFGVAFSPFEFSHIVSNINPSGKGLLTFANTSFYYDFYKFHKNFEVAPFVNTCFLAVQGIDKYKIDAGVSFKLYMDDIFAIDDGTSHFRGEVFNMRSGFRYWDNKPSFFFDLGVNFLVFSAFFFSDVPGDVDAAYEVSKRIPISKDSF